MAPNGTFQVLQVWDGKELKNLTQNVTLEITNETLTIKGCNTHTGDFSTSEGGSYNVSSQLASTLKMCIQDQDRPVLQVFQTQGNLIGALDNGILAIFTPEKQLRLLANGTQFSESSSGDNGD